MAKAEAFKYPQYKIPYDRWIRAGLGGDDKEENYGLYENRLVKIDYGSGKF